MNLWKAAPLFLALAASVPAAAATQPDDKASRWVEHMCSTDAAAPQQAERLQRHADRLAEKLQLTDAQRATFKDLQDTRAKLRADRRTSICASKPDLTTFEARLAYRQTMAEARIADMKAVQPKLVAFYNSLDDQQKAKFEQMRQHGRHHDRG
jgi:hypothetical protein